MKTYAWIDLCDTYNYRQTIIYPQLTQRLEQGIPDDVETDPLEVPEMVSTADDEHTRHSDLNLDLSASNGGCQEIPEDDESDIFPVPLKEELSANRSGLNLDHMEDTNHTNSTEMGTNSEKSADWKQKYLDKCAALKRAQSAISVLKYELANAKDNVNDMQTEIRRLKTGSDTDVSITS